MVSISRSMSSDRSDVVGVVVGMSAGTGDGVDGVLDSIGNGSNDTTEEKRHRSQSHVRDRMSS
jgi:hypothetical protein